MPICDRLLTRIAGMGVWPREYQEGIRLLEEEVKAFAAMYEQLVNSVVRQQEELDKMKEEFALLQSVHADNEAYGVQLIHEANALRARLAALTEAARNYRRHKPW